MQQEPIVNIIQGVDMSEDKQTNSALQSIKLPHADSLKRLAISETGFVFDPETGHSFSVNETGMLVLQQLQQQKNLSQIFKTIEKNYVAEKMQIEKDLIEFVSLLRKQIQESEA